MKFHHSRDLKGFHHRQKVTFTTCTPAPNSTLKTSPRSLFRNMPAFFWNQSLKIPYRNPLKVPPPLCTLSQ